MFSKTAFVKLALVPVAVLAVLSQFASASPAPALEVRGDSSPMARRDWDGYDGKPKNGEDWDEDWDDKKKHGKGKDGYYLAKRGGEKEKHDKKGGKKHGKKEFYEDYDLTARDDKDGKDGKGKDEKGKDEKGKDGHGKDGKGKKGGKN